MLKDKYNENVEFSMRMFFETLNEKDRRRYAAIETLKLGDGGQQYICKILGCDPATIRRGMHEIQEGIMPGERIRGIGGGKKKLLKPQKE